MTSGFVKIKIRIMARLDTNEPRMGFGYVTERFFPPSEIFTLRGRDYALVLERTSNLGGKQFFVYAIDKSEWDWAMESTEGDVSNIRLHGHPASYTISEGKTLHLATVSWQTSESSPALALDFHNNDVVMGTLINNTLAENEGIGKVVRHCLEALTSECGYVPDVLKFYYQDFGRFTSEVRIARAWAVTNALLDGSPHVSLNTRGKVTTTDFHIEFPIWSSACPSACRL